MNRVRVKICGITRPEDARAAVDAGADSIGLNFWEGSKRRCSMGAAREIVASLPPFVTAVAVFVNAPPAAVRSVLDETGIAIAQLHGDERVADYAAVIPQLIKAIRVAGPQWREEAQRQPCTVLLDTATPGFGGSGTAFDWNLVKDAAPVRPWILAGGLTPENVAQAVRVLRPSAVDVASGVESAPGLKDTEKLVRFIRAAKEA